MTAASEIRALLDDALGPRTSPCVIDALHTELVGVTNRTAQDASLRTARFFRPDVDRLPPKTVLDLAALITPSNGDRP